MIYFFTKGTRSAGSSRQRAYNVAVFLDRAGHKAQVIPPPVYWENVSRKRARKEYLKVLFSIRKNDVLYLQTTIFNKWFIVFVYIIKYIFHPRVIFDFDDAIYIRNPIATRTLVNLADYIVVASHYLARWQGLRKKKVSIITNLVDYDLAREYPVIYSEKEKVVLGWIGGAPGALEAFKYILAPVLTQLIVQGIQYKFLLIGALGYEPVKKVFTGIHGLGVEFIDALEWDKCGEIQKANSMFDIGLAPLIDNEDNQARCSLKVLDYMAAGLPVVASAIGEHNYFIEHGKSGFLAATTDEWVELLSCLIKDIELRKSIGTKAHERIHNHYSYQTQMQRYVDLLL